jgi:predicted kinase
MLAERLEVEYGAVRFCPDEWMHALGIDLFDEGMRQKLEQLQWLLAQRLLLLGQAVVIEWGTWGRGERDALREGARALGAAVELRFLEESVDVLWERVRTRRRPGDRELSRGDIESYAARLQSPDTEELALYDAPPIY